MYMYLIIFCSLNNHNYCSFNTQLPLQLICLYAFVLLKLYKVYVIYSIFVGTSDSGNKKVLTGDLDSSLASLAENLTINKVTQPPP